MRADVNVLKEVMDVFQSRMNEVRNKIQVDEITK